VDVGEMQKKLSRWAEEDRTKRFTDLYSLLCNETWLRTAQLHVNANQGSKTAGIDGETMPAFLEKLDGNIERLKESLKAKTFEPKPVRRAYIPKANGKMRPLGIPTIDDRIVQEALRMILEPIWEADFHNRSFGFRPNRGTYDAISYLTNRLTGQGKSYQWVIEGDIASYFDTIPHRRLIKAIKKRVADRDIRDLIWKFLRAGVMYRGDFSDTLTGTPQGGIISPLLANIYLHALDEYMESTYLCLSEAQRQTRRRQGKANYLYARYADDFVVLCNGTKTQAQEMKEELREILLMQMGLELSEEKTRVTHITEGFKFLGYWIIREIGDTGKMVPKVRIPKDAIKRFRYKVREMTSQSTSMSVNAKLLALNQLIRGWCQYYRCTSSPSKEFKTLDNQLHWETAHWLGRKYKISMTTILRRFSDGHTFQTKTAKLVMPTAYKAKKRLTKSWLNPYTGTKIIEREDLFSYDGIWTGHENRVGWRDLRDELIRLKGTTCYVCGTSLHPSEVEVDHIIPRARFKDKTEADRMKQLHPICTSCHRAKTKIDRRVLSRMP
jgi:group II intron reverse transcriptase/maturase